MEIWLCEETLILDISTDNFGPIFTHQCIVTLVPVGTASIECYKVTNSEKYLFFWLNVTFVIWISEVLPYMEHLICFSERIFLNSCICRVTLLFTHAALAGVNTSISVFFNRLTMNAAQFFVYLFNLTSKHLRIKINFATFGVEVLLDWITRPDIHTTVEFSGKKWLWAICLNNFSMLMMGFVAWNSYGWEATC